MNRAFKLCLVAGGLGYVPSLLANPAATDATVNVPAPAYQSAFQDYRSFREEPLADWRRLNEEVGRVGGHLGIFGGAAGHGGHAAPKSSAAETGQPPMRGAPKAPGVKAQHH